MIFDSSMTHTRPVQAEISSSRLIANYRLLLRRAGSDAELMAVVKANAYGHGAAACVPLLAAEGARWFGVTCAAEGVALREASPETLPMDARIVLMSGIWQGEAETVIHHRLTPVVWESWHLDWLDAAAQASGAGQQKIAVHLEIDTGMSRQGVRIDRLEAILARFAESPSIRMEGVMTHFHSPEELDDPATREQTERFVSAVDTIYGRGFCPEILSAGNSATLFSAKEAVGIAALARRHSARFLMRPGLALYGYAPRFHGGSPPLPEMEALQPVLAWKTRVVSLREIQAGETAGYNATFRAERPASLALLPVGYADGLNRLLSGCGHVLIRGQRAPIAGRISMDQTIVDVTEIPGVEIGDEVVLIGTQGNETITAWDLADLTGTIPYEVTCAIGARVPRIMADSR
jgi:alanine racemase